MKYLISKIVDTDGRLVADKLGKGLLRLRNTPGENGLYSGQMVFAQDLRSLQSSIRYSILKND